MNLTGVSVHLRFSAPFVCIGHETTGQVVISSNRRALDLIDLVLLIEGQYEVSSNRPCTFITIPLSMKHHLNEQRRRLANGKLQSGQHNLPVTFHLSNDCPATLTTKQGRIRYTVRFLFTSSKASIAVKRGDDLLVRGSNAFLDTSMFSFFFYPVCERGKHIKRFFYRKDAETKFCLALERSVFIQGRSNVKVDDKRIGESISVMLLLDTNTSVSVLISLEEICICRNGNNGNNGGQLDKISRRVVSRSETSRTGTGCARFLIDIPLNTPPTLIRRNLPISMMFELVLCISRERVVSLPVLIVDSTSCGLSMLNRPLALPCPLKNTSGRQWSHYSNGEENEESVLKIEEIID